MTTDLCMAPNPFPEGFVPGCLPRVTLPGKKFPLFGDKKKWVLTDGEIEQMAGKINNRQFVNQVLNQKRDPSCATEATAQVTMVQRAVSGQPFVLLNPLFIFQATGSRGGSSIDTNLQWVMKHGIAPESVWPRSKGWHTRPSEEAFRVAKDYRIFEFFDITTVREMLSALVLGFTVVYGARGHAVTKLEYLGNGKTLDVNSWGTGWGDGGFGEWASPNSVNWRYGAWAARAVVEAE
jgi:hypothetical protein